MVCTMEKRHFFRTERWLFLIENKVHIGHVCVVFIRAPLAVFATSFLQRRGQAKAKHNAQISRLYGCESGLPYNNRRRPSVSYNRKDIP